MIALYKGDINKMSRDIKLDDRDFALELNDALTETYRNLLKMEERMLQQMNKYHLSISEFHALEAVSKLSPPDNNLSDVAKALDVRRSSATVMMSKLEEKGFVRRVRDTGDKRIVFIELTDLGQEANHLHHKFHMLMVKKLIRQFSNPELDVLLRSVLFLRDFFAENGSAQ